MAGALPQAFGLRELVLRGCSLRCADAVALGEGLVGNDVLRVLDLGENWIGQEGAVALSEALGEWCVEGGGCGADITFDGTMLPIGV